MDQLLAGLPTLAGKFWQRVIGERIWLRLLSPSAMRLLAPLLAVAAVYAGWQVWRLAGRTPLGRVARWWAAAVAGAGLAAGLLYTLAAPPEDPEALALLREALADGQWFKARLPAPLALGGTLVVAGAAVLAAGQWRFACSSPEERAALAAFWHRARRLGWPVAGAALATVLAAAAAVAAAASGAGQVPSLATVPSAAAGGATLWVGTSVGLSRLVPTPSGPRWEALRRPQVPLPANRVTGIAAGPSGEVWIATHGGLARYSPGAPGQPGDSSWATATVENDGLPYPTVLGLAVDRRGVAWAATGAGAAMVDRRPATGQRWASRAFTNVNAPLLHQILDAVYVDPQGQVWFGGAGGVNVYRPETADSPSDWLTGFNQESTQGSLPDNQVYTIVGDSKGRVWFGTARGATVLTPDGAAFGMGAFDAWRWQTFDRPPDTPLAGDTVQAIVEDRQGRLYFGTRRGVTVLDEAQSDPAQRWRRLGAGSPGQPGLPDPWVQALAFGPDGRLWAGTRGGLAVYDPARPQEGWQAYRANALRRWAGYLWPELWERNILGDDVTALAWG